MEKELVEILKEALEGKLIIENNSGTIKVNCCIVGNSKFKEFCDKKGIEYTYKGGDNYEVLTIWNKAYQEAYDNIENVAEWKYKDKGKHRPTNYNVVRLATVSKIIRELRQSVEANKVSL